MKSRYECYLQAVSLISLEVVVLEDTTESNPKLRDKLNLSMEEVAMTAAGVGTAMLSNSMKARPLYAGIQRHILFGLIGFTGGYFIKKYRMDYARRKWLAFEDYIARHPEKFEEPPKVYFKDFIQPWTPVR